MCSALVVVYNSFLPLSAKVFSTKCLPMSIGETFLLRSFPLCSTFIQAVDVHCCSPAYYINLAHIPMHVINVPEHRQWNNFLRSVVIVCINILNFHVLQIGRLKVQLSEQESSKQVQSEELESLREQLESLRKEEREYKAKVDTSKAELDKLQKTNLALQSDISQVLIL